MRRVGLALAGLLVLGTLGCGGSRGAATVSYSEAAEAAYEDAERVLRRRDYELARLKYTEVYQQYPYSQFAALAEFRVGDTYYRERLYARAIESYRRFVRIHPSHELVPEAQWKIALSYVEQMPRDFFPKPPSHERDLTEVENAHRALESFVASYADSEFAGQARERLQVTTDRLASYELYAAEYYARRRNPRASAMRCEYLLENYPESLHVVEARFLYARALVLMGDMERAVELLRALQADAAEHRLAPEIDAWLARHAGAESADLP